MIRVISLACLIILLPGCTHEIDEIAHQLSGIVVDAESGMPLPGATVELRGRGNYSGAVIFRVITNDDGRYYLGPSIGSIPPGTVVFEKVGYRFQARLYPEEARTVGEYEYRIDAALPRVGMEPN